MNAFDAFGSRPQIVYILGKQAKKSITIQVLKTLDFINSTSKCLHLAIYHRPIYDLDVQFYLNFGSQLRNEQFQSLTQRTSLCIKWSSYLGSIKAKYSLKSRSSLNTEGFLKPMLRHFGISSLDPGNQSPFFLKLGLSFYTQVLSGSSN